MKFDKIPMWIRVHDLPFNWLNEERAKVVASQIGELIRLDSYWN